MKIFKIKFNLYYKIQIKSLYFKFNNNIWKINLLDKKDYKNSNNLKKILKNKINNQNK